MSVSSFFSQARSRNTVNFMGVGEGGRSWNFATVREIRSTCEHPIESMSTILNVCVSVWTTFTMSQGNGLFGLLSATFNCRWVLNQRKVPIAPSSLPPLFKKATHSIGGWGWIFSRSFHFKLHWSFDSIHASFRWILHSIFHFKKSCPIRESNSGCWR